MAARRDIAEQRTAKGLRTAAQVVKLRHDGMTYEDIANKIGMSLSGAYHAYWRGIRYIEQEQLPKLATAVVTRQLQFCDQTYRKNRKKALDGDNDAHKRVMDVFAVERKLLGLDVKEAPNPQEPTEFHGSLDERKAQLLELVRKIGQKYLEGGQSE